MPTLDTRAVRRLAVARAGLLTPERTGLPRRASGSGLRARKGAWHVLRRFGYLQLDSVSVVGARTHGLVLLSRLDGFEPHVAEELLRPGDPVFEYWGHEASWLPMELYPAFGWRRRKYKVHPWWGPLLDDHSQLAGQVLKLVHAEGPMRTTDLKEHLGGDDKAGWWGHGKVKKVLSALWSSGELGVSERRSFHRRYDLTERVIPGEARAQDMSYEDALEVLLLKALDGHGWATRSTLAATWRFKKMWDDLDAALERLRERGEIVPAIFRAKAGDETDGWVRTRDLELAETLRTVRPRKEVGILLSPFDPLLWDRRRVEQLFGFEQVLEIYTPAEKRRWGYYCLPILAGEHLVGRVDLKAHRPKTSSKKSSKERSEKRSEKTGGRLEVRALHYEREKPSAADREAARTALDRLAGQLGLDLWADDAAELRRRLGEGR